MRNAGLGSAAHLVLSPTKEATDYRGKLLPPVCGVSHFMSFASHLEAPQVAAVIKMLHRVLSSS